jgi:hypothetical protein
MLPSQAPDQVRGSAAVWNFAAPYDRCGSACAVPIGGETHGTAGVIRKLTFI